MSFVLFAGWFAGSPVALAHYPTFAFTGLVSFFGSVNVAIPLLLDILRIPVDLFQLYLAITVVVSRFSVLLTTMNNLVLTLVGTCAVTGLSTIRWGGCCECYAHRHLQRGSPGRGTGLLRVAVDNAYHKDKILAGMHLLRTRVQATVHRTPPPEPVVAPSQSSLERIRTQGILRVGYLPDNMPFAYFNASGELVGFDIEMAHTLARDLGVQLEFVPIERSRMVEQVNAGYCDLIMSGVAVTPDRALVWGSRHPTWSKPWRLSSRITAATTSAVGKPCGASKRRVSASPMYRTTSTRYSATCRRPSW